MNTYEFKHITGMFYFDEKGNKSKQKSKEELPVEIIPKVMLQFKDKKYFKEFYEQNIRLTRQSIRESVTKDQMIVQAAGQIDELDKAANILVKRLREWYELYNPEWSHKITKHEHFVDSILKGTEKRIKDTMGAELGKADLEAINHLAERIDKLYKLKDVQEKYIEKVMKDVCPNMLAITGALIGAKLLQHAGSLKRMVTMPASTVQLLGAEKALFRHLKTGAKSPKHGVIIQHPLLAKAKADMRGKVARVLADKISIAVKIDYFKGEFIGDKLMKELEVKFK